MQRTSTMNTDKEKKYVTIGTINIGAITNKCEAVVQLMSDKGIKILGLAETRWRGKDRRTLHNNYELFYSGNPNQTKSGVVIIIEEEYANHAENITYVNGILMAMTLNIKDQRTSFIQAYAPQQGRPNKEKERFYEDLEASCDQMPLNSYIIIMGDPNGHVRTKPVPGVVGNFGVGTINYEGKVLVDLAIRNNMAVMNTFFNHKDSHKYTWYRYNQNVQAHDLMTQIDFVLCNNKAIIKDVRAMPLLSLDSDYRLLKQS